MINSKSVLAFLSIICGLSVSVAMGDDRPLTGNMVKVDKPVGAEIPIGENWSIRPMSGHTVGSVVMDGTTATGETVLLAGDTLALWHHPDSRIQLCIFEEQGQGSNKLRAEIDKPWQHLCCCTGWLSEPQEALKSLLKSPIPTARPNLAEKGGVWGDPWDDRWIALQKE